MIGRLNHVAIATQDLESASAFYRDILGAEVSSPVDLPEHGVTTVFVTLPNSKIELLTPLGAHSPIQKFLTAKPEGGIHHLCYEVEDIENAQEKLTKAGLRILGDGIKIGAHGLPVLFMHPKDAGGVLIELEQKAP